MTPALELLVRGLFKQAGRSRIDPAEQDVPENPVILRSDIDDNIILIRIIIEQHGHACFADVLHPGKVFSLHAEVARLFFKGLVKTFEPLALISFPRFLGQFMIAVCLFRIKGHLIAGQIIAKGYEQIALPAGRPCLARLLHCCEGLWIRLGQHRVKGLPVRFFLRGFF